MSTHALLSDGSLVGWGVLKGPPGTNSETIPIKADVATGLGQSNEGFQPAVRSGSGSSGNGTSLRFNILKTPQRMDLGVNIAGLAIIEFAALYDRQCIILSDTSLRCWGSNTGWVRELGGSTPASEVVGVLLAGSTDEYILSPQKVEFPITGVVPMTVIASGQVMCTLTTDKMVYCWGVNKYGIVGVGGLYDEVFATPQRVNLTNVAQLTPLTSSITGAMCATLENGDLMCWGGDYGGTLGQCNNTNNAFVPVLIDVLMRCSDDDPRTIVSDRASTVIRILAVDGTRLSDFTTALMTPTQTMVSELSGIDYQEIFNVTFLTPTDTQLANELNFVRTATATLRRRSGSCVVFYVRWVHNGTYTWIEQGSEYAGISIIAMKTQYPGEPTMTFAYAACPSPVARPTTPVPVPLSTTTNPSGNTLLLILCVLVVTIPLIMASFVVIYMTNWGKSGYEKVKT
jgi:hypothetical protein